VTLQGAGASSTTINGVSPWLSVITINSGYTVAIADVAVTGGRPGIFNQGTANLTNSTISGNSKDGILNWTSAAANLTNCTVSGNWASGINNKSSGTVTLTNCTVSNQGRYGVLNRGTANLTNSIVTENYTYGGSYRDCSGLITSNGYNLDSDGTCVTDGVNNDITSATPGLGPLQDNGGPTQTHALLDGSPAIDAILEGGTGYNGAPPTDQRVAARPQPTTGGNCDIGAYELEQEPTAIDLVSFTAQAGADGVALAWETGTEIDNAGFNLYRALTQDGPWTQINDGLIAALGDPVNGASYSFLDAPDHGTFYYQLEDVDYHGVSTLHGPVRVTVARPLRRPLYRPTLPQF
jgi:hypothetical protein